MALPLEGIVVVDLTQNVAGSFCTQVSQPAIAKLDSGRTENLSLEAVVRWARALGRHIRVEVSRTSPRRKAGAGRP